MTGICAGSDDFIVDNADWTAPTAGCNIDVWKGAETLSLIGLGSWPENVRK